MAIKKVTPKPRPPKTPGSRWLTVRDQLYMYPVRKDGSQRENTPVPWLQMRGHWLAAAGFGIRTPVRVRVMQGCLVLTAEDD